MTGAVMKAWKNKSRLLWFFSFFASDPWAQKNSGCPRYVPRTKADELLEWSKGREDAPPEVLAAFKSQADRD